MEAVWAAARPLAVREVLNVLNDERKQPLAYTTVMTVMSRLAEKGALLRERAGRGFAYQAAAAGPAALAVRTVVRDYGEAAIAEFVNQARADEEIMQRLQRLLDEEP